MAQGDIATAVAHVEFILEHLQHHHLHGTDEPMRVYLTCYHVLKGANDERAKDVLASALSMLEERARSIEDETLRKHYLEDVPAHQEIMALTQTAVTG